MLTYEEVRQRRIALAKAEGDRYRELSEQVSPELEGGWAAMAHPDLIRIVEMAAYAITKAFDGHIEKEDALQETWIILGSREKVFDLAKAALEDEEVGLGALKHALVMDLIDHYRPIAKRMGWAIPHASIEALRDRGEEF
jgi:hypothetical protein